MQTHTHTHTHLQASTFTFAHTHTYIPAHTLTWTHAQICTRTHASTHAPTHANAHSHNACLHTRLHAHMYVCTMDSVLSNSKKTLRTLHLANAYSAEKRQRKSPSAQADDASSFKAHHCIQWRETSKTSFTLHISPMHTLLQ